jgi:hypothetical protein
VSLLTALGLLSLALAGLSGWLVALTVERPGVFGRVGITAPGRIRQVHLDWVMMGLILIAVDLAVPDRPGWTTAAIAFGTIVNPLLFLPLMWGKHVSQHLAYRAVTGVSFVATSVGLTAVATHYALTA